MVSDNLEAANHLTDGEETEALGSNDTGGGELGIAEVAGLLEDVLGCLEEGASLEGSPKGLVGVLESGHGAASHSMLGAYAQWLAWAEGGGRKHGYVRRAHLLALEDQLGNLGADLGVVDNEGGLA